MRYILSIVVFFVFSSSAHAGISNPPAGNVLWENYKTSISAGIGLMRGHTTYQIGGKIDTPEGSGRIRFPLSELIFPLDIRIGTLEAEVSLNQNWTVTAGIKKNISSEAGKMKDSDWGINYYDIVGWTDPDSLDIYSESDTDAEAFIAELAVKYYVVKQRSKKTEFKLFVGGKYIYHHFDFDVSNVHQWYPSLPEEPHFYDQDKVLTYEVTKHIPAVTIGAELFTKYNFRLDAMIGYSPFVTVEDEDDHILRGKLSKAECDGDAVFFSLAGSYRFHRNWTINLEYDYIYIDTDGRQKQYDYVDGFDIGTIDTKNFSETSTYGVSVSYLF